MMWGARPRSLSHLIVSSLDPLLVEPMSPEVALAVISRMFLATVDASESVRTRNALRRGGNRGGGIGIALAAAGKSAVVLFAVGA